MNAALITSVDKPFARFLAASARELKRDPELTPMGAFDTLQKIHRRYADRWLLLQIVCENGYWDVYPNTPVQIALERIEQNGGAVGLLGITIINQTFTFLKKPLRPGKKVLNLLDKKGNEAADRFLAIAQRIAEIGKQKQ